MARVTEERGRGGGGWLGYIGLKPKDENMMDRVIFSILYFYNLIHLHLPLSLSPPSMLYPSPVSSYIIYYNLPLSFPFLEVLAFLIIFFRLLRDRSTEVMFLETY